MIIFLNGWCSDRELGVLQRMLMEAGKKPVMGRFLGDRFIAEENVDAATQNLIANYFRPMSLGEVKIKRLEEIRRVAGEKILGKYPVYYQLNVGSGIYGADKATPMKAHINSVISASNAAEAAVNSAASIDEIVGLPEPVWP